MVTMMMLVRFLMSRIILILFRRALLGPSSVLLLGWLRDFGDTSTSVIILLHVRLFEPSHALVLFLLLLLNCIFVILIEYLINFKQPTRSHPFQPFFWTFILLRWSCHRY
jgi:hypothetical protein